MREQDQSQQLMLDQLNGQVEPSELQTEPTPGNKGSKAKAKAKKQAKPSAKI